MTIHCAITYFDQKTESVGYLLGSDSRAVYSERNSFIPIECQVDKSILGKRTVGFVRGHLRGNNKDFSETLKILENNFENIEEGRNYSNLHQLKNFESYVLMIVKQTPEALDLFTISNARESDLNVAKRLHRIIPQMFNTEDTWFWYAPYRLDYLELKTNKMSFNEAKYSLKKLLTIYSKELRAFF